MKKKIFFEHVQLVILLHNMQLQPAIDSSLSEQVQGV